MPGAYLTEEEKRQQQLDSMTPEQREAYQTKRSRYFKGTIAVCVIYGTLALGLFIIALVSERGRAILAEDLLPFTMTFIGGMLFVIIVLTLQVINFAPPAYDSSDPADMLCPDYWQIAPTPKSMVDAAPVAADRYKMAYMCMNKNKAQGSRPAQVIPDDQDGSRVNGKLQAIARTMYPTAADKTLNCNYVYPQLMSVADKKEFPQTGNRLRCRYSEICKAPWSAACPK